MTEPSPLYVIRDDEPVSDISLIEIGCALVQDWWIAQPLKFRLLCRAVGVVFCFAVGYLILVGVMAQ